MKKTPQSPGFFMTLILTFVAILSLHNVAGTVIFQDATFNNADWNSILIPTSVSGAIGSGNQDTISGYPLPSRLTIHTYPTGTIYVAHTFQATSPYNLAQGSIANLSYSYDLNHSTPLNVAYSLLVFQNNTYYYVLPSDLIAGSTWQHFTRSNLTAASFTKLYGPSNNVKPDFSCAGAPIVFGYVTRNTNSIVAHTDTTRSRLDNWKVIINEADCCAAQPPNMVAWWNLDEGTGANIVDDTAGFNNQAKPKPLGVVGFGSPESVAGKVHGALYFAAGYLEVAPQMELDFGNGGFTIDAWIKPVDCPPPGGTRLSGIVDKSSATTGISFYLNQLTVGLGRLYLKMNNSPVFASSGPNGTIPTLGSSPPWTHVAVTVSRPSVIPPRTFGTFYINGLPAGTFSPPSGTVTNLLPLWIGKSRLPSGVCEIAIDELELFNRPLSAAEVKSIADAKTAGKCP